MAEQSRTSSLRIVVTAEGEQQLRGLAQTFSQINAGAGARPRAIRPTGDAERAGRTVGEQLGEWFGRQVVGPTLMSPFTVVSRAAGMAVRPIISVAGPLARMGVAAVGATSTALAAGIAIVAIGIPLFQLAATLKILRTSFGW